MKTLDQLIDEQNERAKRRRCRGVIAKGLPPKRRRKLVRMPPEVSRVYREAKYAKWRAMGIVS